MIHYHGLPISGPVSDFCRFYVGRSVLVPWLSFRLLPEVAEYSRSFVLDNSAYNFWEKKKRVNWSLYEADVEQWSRHPGFDWAVIPDVIDGSEDENDQLIEDWDHTIEAYPVWHLHESIDRLKRLCTRYRRVCLGSSGDFRTPNSKTWWSRVNEFMPEICDVQGRPLCKLHGLRMLDPRVFTQIPLSSADSVNAGMNAGSLRRFGTYPHPTAQGRASVIADRIESFNSCAVWTNETRFNGLSSTAKKIITGEE